MNMEWGMEQKLNENGIGMKQEWNDNGTGME